MDFCVLIPCFNDQPGLEKALRSINYQADKCLIVVVDDGSRPALSLDQIASWCPYQVKLISLPQNRGITTALNEGLKWIIEETSVPLIARLDCEDICDAQRFFKQVAFMRSHPEISLLGTWCQFKNASGSIKYTYKTPADHSHIIKALPFRNVFIHPTVIFRTGDLRRTGLYPFDYPYAEDYALFWKMAQSGRTAILKEVLVTCALRDGGLSMKNRGMQLKSREKIVWHFEKNMLLKAAGLLKLWSLKILPFGLLVKLRKLYRINTYSFFN